MNKTIFGILMLLTISLAVFGFSQKTAPESEFVGELSLADFTNCQDPDSVSTFDKNQLLVKSVTKYNSGSVTDRCYTWYAGTSQEKTRLIEGTCKEGKLLYWYADCNVSLGKDYQCLNGTCVKSCVDVLPYCNGDVLVNQTGNTCTRTNTYNIINCANEPFAPAVTCYDSDKLPYYGSDYSKNVFAQCLGCGWAVCEKDNKLWMDKEGVCDVGWNLVEIVDGPNCN